MRNTLVIGALLLSPPAYPQCGEQVLFGNDTIEDDRFGSALAVSGDVLVVGAHSASESGRVYVFERTPTGYVEVQVLAPSVPNPQGLQRFGDSLAIDGETLVVGAPGFDAGVGLVYVFELGPSGWEETFVIDDPDLNSSFGNAVAIGGGQIFVGRPYPFPMPGPEPQAVHVYERSGPSWLEVQVIEPSRATFMFGYTIALDGDRLLVGSPEPPDAPGSAFVYKRTVNGWLEEQRLIPSDGMAYDLFGLSLDLDGATALIGARSQDGPLGNAYGAAYVFRLDTQTGVWSETQKLVASDAQPGHSFGNGVALSGTCAFVGAPNEDDFGSSSGAIYVFETAGGTWIEMSKRYSPAPTAGHGFGGDALANGSEALISAAGGDYVVSAVKLLGVPYCDVNPNSTGVSAAIWSCGESDVATNEFVLGARHLPPNKFGYFLLSQSQGFFPNPGGSQGNLCIAGPIGRFQSEVQNSGSDGAIEINVDLTDIPLFGSIVAGETWNFQCWYRDVGGNSNFTGGITVPFQ